MSLLIHRFSHEAMTTNFEALIIHEDAKYAGQAAAEVFAEIDRQERLLSRHDPGTDIAHINRMKPGEWMRVNLEVIEVLEIAARAFIETGGAFDVAYRSTAGGTRPSAMNYLLLSRPDSPEPDTPSDFLVGIDPEAANHGFESAEIDLGGIGKGYALDKAMCHLDEWEISNALLSSGTSSVLARGSGPDGQSWLVGVSGDYRDETGVRSTLLQNASLSGSGTAVKGEHIKDPHSGESAPAIASWAKAPTAAWSEVISTTMMIMSKPEAEDFLKQHGPDISAIAVYPSGLQINYLIHGSW